MHQQNSLQYHNSYIKGGKGSQDFEIVKLAIESRSSLVKLLYDKCMHGYQSFQLIVTYNGCGNTKK